MRRPWHLPLCVFPKQFRTDTFGGFGTILNLKRSGGFEFVEVLHHEIGNVELEARAFELQPFHADLLFAQAHDEADDFVVEAGGNFVLGDDFHGTIDESGDDRVFDGVGVAAGHDEFLGGFGLFTEVYAGDGHLAYLVKGADCLFADVNAEFGKDAFDGTGEVFLAVFDPGENFGALLGGEAGVERRGFRIDVRALGGDEVFRVGGGFGRHIAKDEGGKRKDESNCALVWLRSAESCLVAHEHDLVAIEKEAALDPDQCFKAENRTLGRTEGEKLHRTVRLKPLKFLLQSEARQQFLDF
jgi:hypothetical protein